MVDYHRKNLTVDELARRTLDFVELEVAQMVESWTYKQVHFLYWFPNYVYLQLLEES